MPLSAQPDSDRRSVRISTLGAGALIAVLGLTGCGDASPTGAAGGEATVVSTPSPFNGSGRERFKVLSRNVYIGGDVGPVLQVDFSDIVAVTMATAAVWQTVQQTDFATRVEALADEIASTNPHVVGLQEVARYVTLTGQLQPTGGMDYLLMLQAALGARGLAYTVRVQENTNITLPIALDLQTGTVLELLNFTDRDAVLVREDVTVHDEAQANYAAQLELVPGVFLKRGWMRVAAEFGGQHFHVINTHLESQTLAPVQAGQAAELMGPVTAGLVGPKILVGDLNSDAAAGPGVPSWTPTYGDLVADGWVDVWAQVNPGKARSGLTCCHDPDLSNTASGLDERIDFVLVKDGPGLPGSRLRGSIKIDVLGDASEDRTAGGLWPSDHAGLIAGIRLPRGLMADGN